jgi:SAM-dependent methyltransferase
MIFTQRFKSLKSLVRKFLQRTKFGYLYLLHRDHEMTQPVKKPKAKWHNAVLKTSQEVEAARQQVHDIGLFQCVDEPKNWDSLAALDCLLDNTNQRARILDAGAEKYSVILPWLALNGYKNLWGNNLVFEKAEKQGPITFEYGDITQTKYEDEFFDAITCMSVVEHGVDIKTYLREMQRILKPGGVLITSTDYWEQPVDTTGKYQYGTQVHLFHADEIRTVIEDAKSIGFDITSEIDLTSDEKAVYWAAPNLHYTFIIFTLRKRTG